MTPEQQKALALSRSRQRQTEANPSGQQAPLAMVPNSSITGDVESPGADGGIASAFASVSREATPYLAAGLTGAAIGAPVGGVGAVPGFLGGVGAYGLSRALGDVIFAGDEFGAGGYNAPTVSELADTVMDNFLPRPDSAQDRVAATATRGAMDALSGAGVGRTLAREGAGPIIEGVSKVAGPVVKRLPFVGSRVPQTADQGARAFGEFLSKTPRADMGLGALGGATYQGMIENEATPVQAGLTGAIVPTIAGVGYNLAARRFPNMVGPQNISAFFGGADDQVEQVVNRAVDSVPGAGLTGGGRTAGAATQAVNDVSALLKDRVAMSGSIDDALLSMDEAENVFSGGLVKPDAATASNNTGFMGLLRSQANDPTVSARARNNKQAINEEISSALQPIPGSPPRAAQNYVRGELDSNLQAAKTKLDADQSALSNLEGQAEVAGDPINRATASRDTLPELQNKRAEMDKIAEDLAQKIPKDAPVKITAETKKGVVSVLNEFKNRPTSSAPVEVQSLASLIKRVNKGQGTISSGEAHQIYKDLYALIGGAQTQNEKRLLGIVRDALRKDLESAPGVDVPFKEFNRFYSEEFAPAYLQGASRDVLINRAKGGQSQLSPEATLDRFLRVSRNEGGRDANRLIRALSGRTGLDPTAEKIIGDWLESSISSVIKSSKTDKAAAANAWLDKHSLILAELPNSARDRVMKIQSDLGLAQSSLKTSKDAFKKAESNITSTTPGKFSAKETDPVGFVESAIFEGANPKVEIYKLIKATRTDKTGSATKALKNSVMSALDKHVRNVGKTTEDNIGDALIGNNMASFAKLNKALSDPKIVSALKLVLSPDEMSAIERTRKKIAIASRITDTPTGGSITAYMKPPSTQFDEIMQGVAGRGQSTTAPVASQGRTLKTIKDIFVSVARTATVDAEQLAKFQREVLIKALLDPDVARALLRRPTPENLKTTSSVIMPIARSVLMGTGYDKDQQSMNEK